jgi:biotin carboxyl carrier protein
MQIVYQHGDEQIGLQVESVKDGWRVRLPDGSERTITAQRVSDGILQIIEGDRTFNAAFAKTKRGLEIAFGGQVFVFTDPAASKRNRKSVASGSLTAPMVGVVADVLVQAGDTVASYQPIAVVSAMKVYGTVEAPFAGTVTAVHVKKDQRVEHGALLAEIEPASEEPQP